MARIFRKENKPRMRAWKLTFEFFKKLGTFDEFTFGKIAQLCGKKSETAQAWARPVESDEFPTGTGKRNPFDVVIRLLGMAHKVCPGLAREWAQMFLDYVDFLDRRQTGKQETIKALAAKSAKEHLDVVLMILDCDELDLPKINTEICQAQAALNNLQALVKEEMKAEFPAEIH